MIIALLDQGIRGSEKAFFTDRDRLQAFADTLNTKTRSASVQPDEEHQAFGIVIEDRTGGYPKYHRVDLDFVLTTEFRTLANSYQDVKGIKGADDRQDHRRRRRQRGRRRGGRRGRAGGRGRHDHRRRHRRRRDQARRRTEAPQGPQAKDQQFKVESLDDLVEFFIAAGKKGIAVNRYKGLGEMNPDTLWETTMDPAKRTLLQVKAEDHPAADLMFTTLMGDQVEPRRKFIEDNALDVKNLDI